MQLITHEELEMLLDGRNIYKPRKCPHWLSFVRMLPCMHRGCDRTPAGTVHHVFTAGIAMRCDDRLTIPLCIEDHVIGGNAIQNMNNEEFEEAIGMSKKDAVRRVYTVIMDQINRGEFI